MERVTGIGGFFFRAKNPKKLAAWYEHHLGIPKVPQTYEERTWWQDEVPTVIDPFDDSNEFLGKYPNPWIINFRVHNLDAMAEQLRSAGIDVDVDPKTYPNGRFVLLEDPEGNPVQLWEAGGTDLNRPVQKNSRTPQPQPGLIWTKSSFKPHSST